MVSGFQQRTRQQRGLLSKNLSSSGRHSIQQSGEELMEDRDLMLRSDIRMLGNRLGEIIRTHDSKVFESVQLLRSLSREWRAIDPTSSSKFTEHTESLRSVPFEAMVKEVASYDAQKLLTLARAFTHFLALSNSAENHHRVRRLRHRMMSTTCALSPKADSCSGTVHRLLGEKGESKDEVYRALCQQSVEIVLTAHPTEVNRRTMLQKHQRVIDVLEAFDRTDLTSYEIRDLDRKLHIEISSIWETDELRRSKPTPVEEARGGLNIVQDVLWHAVPDFIRKLDDMSRHELGRALPLDIAPIKLGSWMGGDRDGNPNVTPSTTRTVSNISRETAAFLFLQDIRTLKAHLSMKTASAEVMQAAGLHSVEPYRAILEGLQHRLEATWRWTRGETKSNDESMILICSSELMQPLCMLHSSLVSTGRPEIANGLLTDTIRRLAAFGLTMLPLDIRQESTRHSEALDAVTRYLGIGSYIEWSEEEKRDWLSAELQSKRPLLPRTTPLKSLGFSANVVDTLETFELIATLKTGSLGAYVISQCQQASDVLAVALLQQDAGVKNQMRVVPLFETLDDLQRSADTVSALFSLPVYKKYIDGKQEIMVGYSDSAKDAGRIAASWVLYNCQEAIVKIAAENGVDITFFHGKGGTVGRGGNPALFKAIIAHPPNTINGRFRVTEQGEMITQNFGQKAVAERTLDLFTAGVLAERFHEHTVPKQDWRDAMARLSKTSCETYRSIVREDPRFVPYFRAATPELELSGLNVGSRPAKRNPKGGVESLRAIPWVFAWTQTRLNLPAWLGVGDSIKQEMSVHGQDENMKEMYIKWPWFTTMMDLLEMILVKSERRIAENYDKQLVLDDNSLQLGRELRQKLDESCKSVLLVSGHSTLQSGNAILLRSLAVRNPYIDPLNVIQAELLKRARTRSIVDEKEQKLLSDALLITINGIAAGMRNSG